MCAPRVRLAALAALTAACFLAACMLGRFPVSPAQLFHVLAYRLGGLAPDWPPQLEAVIFHIRLPRVAAAALVGAGLSAAGAAYQSLFNNPLVSPDLLGASAGAGFGAALAIISGAAYAMIPASAFVFGLCAVLLAALVSVRAQTNPSLALVLAGIMISSLFHAGTSYLKLIADQTNALPAITFWLMGSLAGIRAKDLLFAAAPVFAGLCALFLCRWQLNIMMNGEDEARALGVNTRALRAAVIGGATLITAACVSISGMIGWVGLVVPHFARLLVGCDNRVLLPAAMFLGASFLLAVDTCARLVAASEIPIGILTAFVGAPFFVYLIARRGNQA